ncbi:MAG: sirohydrochlorin chelatase [Actinomycetota bacterium]|nr:sirohydrochlorin chelatase [Actinomycetota bacterium]
MVLQRTIVVAAHGTRDTAGVAVAHQLVDALRARLPGSSVLLGFVDVLGPGVREVVASAPGPVTVVPTFLSSGYHVRADLPRAVASSQRNDVMISAALGPHPLLVAAMGERLGEAGWHRGDAVVLAAAGSSDPRVGFVATGAPRVAPLVAGLRAAGESRIAIASWLLAPGLFSRRLDTAEADVVAAPLGTHPKVVDRLIQLAGVSAVLRSA